MSSRSRWKGPEGSYAIRSTPGPNQAISFRKPALDAKGQAVFFTRRGRMLGSVPPPVNRPKLTPALPPAPPLRPGEMYNGAARLADGAVPWEIEAAAREAIEAGARG